jgi:hypothetical protein
MTEPSRPTLPRWALAALAGATSALLLFALLGFGLGFETEVSAFLSGALALCVSFATARYVTAAGIVMGVARMVATAAVTVGSIIVALLGLWT